VALVANILLADDDAEAMAERLASAPTVRFAAGVVWFDTPLALHDDDDEDSALFVLYGLADGAGLTVRAETDDIAELERRVVRNIGLDATIDDHGEAAS
jgi:hypothetical protein